MWEKCGYSTVFNLYSQKNDVFNLLAKSKIKTKNKSETIISLTKRKFCLLKLPMNS